MRTLVKKRVALVGSAALVPLGLLALAAATRDATLLAWSLVAVAGSVLVARFA